MFDGHSRRWCLKPFKDCGLVLTVLYQDEFHRPQIQMGEEKKRKADVSLDPRFCFWQDLHLGLFGVFSFSPSEVDPGQGRGNIT